MATFIRLENRITGLYHRNLEGVWDSLLPAPDIRVIRNDGTIQKVDQTIQAVAAHYLWNIGQLVVCLAVLPITFTASVISSSLCGRAAPAKAPEREYEPPAAYGYANSGFQDGGIGTTFDPSSLKGYGIGDWNELLLRAAQQVTADGKKIGSITHGITLEEGQTKEDLFVNIMDHPTEYAKLLKAQGCTAYRISLERSVIESNPREFNEFVIGKYRALFQALKDEGIEPWVTLHHFTNPQWFAEQGGFEKEENISGFVNYCERMAAEFSAEVENWMTFNEPGIRALEGYVRGEHPPEQKNIAVAAQVIRNLMIAHTKAYAAMKEVNQNLNIGITHQWLRFLPFSSWNPIEKITAFFFTSLIHTPLFNFYRDGKLHVKMPFRANVQLVYERKETPKFADFLGVQAYGFPRIKVGFSGGKTFPGAADKVNNLILWRNWFGFTAGSTCGEGGSMQYFGPPSKPTDLIPVLDEAFSIPLERIPEIGITETGADARRMKFGEKGMKVDNEAQAADMKEIAEIVKKYHLVCLFFWTLNRHCEWLSGGLPHLGVTKVRNKGEGFEIQQTAGLQAVREIFNEFRRQQEQARAVA